MCGADNRQNFDFIKSKTKKTTKNDMRVGGFFQLKNWCSCMITDTLQHMVQFGDACILVIQGAKQISLKC